MGDTDTNLAQALGMICELEGVAVIAVSPIYRTEPQEQKDQSWFANQVVAVQCDASVKAQVLLDELLVIEKILGRVRKERFGARVIDLDVLLFGTQVISTEKLTVPHPRMRERAFVLVPLRDIAPKLHFPDGKGVEEILSNLEYKVEADQIWQ